VALVMSGGEAFFVQMARCGVSARPEGLTVQQPLSRVDVPWSQVDDVTVDDAGALTIALSSGHEVPVYAFGGSLIGMFTKSRHAQRARDGLLAARQAASADPAEPSPVTSRTTIYWRWALTTALALEAAAAVGLLAH
jgi:Bacterial PH domain